MEERSKKQCNVLFCTEREKYLQYEVSSQRRKLQVCRLFCPNFQMHSTNKDSGNKPTAALDVWLLDEEEVGGRRVNPRKWEVVASRSDMQALLFCSEECQR